MADFQTLDRGDGVLLAYERIEGHGPTFVWLSGYRSEMTGTKAQFLADWARARGQGFVRFDYSGHGLSQGAFEEQDIEAWRGDALAIIDRVAAGRLVLVGSSMGGWVALLAALARPERVAGLLLIAPAWDFTERLLWPRLPDEARKAILETGGWAQPSPYGGTTVYTARLFAAGRRRLIPEKIAFPGPVRILQGRRDPDVPWSHAAELAERIKSPDLSFITREDGDHRLSTPEDLAVLAGCAEELTQA